MPLGVEFLLLGAVSTNSKQGAESRQPNNLPLKGRKLILTLDFYFFRSESSRIDKSKSKLHYNQKITSR